MLFFWVFILRIWGFQFGFGRFGILRSKAWRACWSWWRARPRKVSCRSGHGSDMLGGLGLEIGWFGLGRVGDCFGIGVKIALGFVWKKVISRFQAFAIEAKVINSYHDLHQKSPHEVPLTIEPCQTFPLLEMMISVDLRSFWKKNHTMKLLLHIHSTDSNSLSLKSYCISMHHSIK